MGKSLTNNIIYHVTVNTQVEMYVLYWRFWKAVQNNDSTVIRCRSQEGSFAKSRKLSTNLSKLKYKSRNAVEMEWKIWKAIGDKTGSKMAWIMPGRIVRHFRISSKRLTTEHRFADYIGRHK